VWLVWDRFLLRPATVVTFSAVRHLIAPFMTNPIADPATLALGSQKFAVTIAGACSGWEGVGLSVVFSVIWLWIYRRECRFPQALILIPAGMAVMFGLNILRITALILIGNAGAARVAMSGFHSQAGWISFNTVAFGIAWIAPRIEWLASERGVRKESRTSGDNPTVPYLLPFAVILAAGMVSRAASYRFEWLYPLRFIAAATVLWVYRKEYSFLKRRPGWMSLVAGTLVFGLWIWIDGGSHEDNGIAQGLASLPAAAAGLWIVTRVLAAVITVPIAEELAFRGFLLRRFVAPNFETIEIRRVTLLAVAASSLLFGLMHGGRWIPGTIAGAAYAAVAIRRNNLGDAVAAHATSNLLLAIWVLVRHDWFLW
jgi:exosortase E/protease (VPEID-CTERM system)